LFTRSSFCRDEILGRHPDVLGDLPQEGRLEISALVERDGRGSTVRVAELFVAPSLSDLDEA
jgi:hypothetical protein